MQTASRNDPCPCGSGKKYKHCCLQRHEAVAASKRAEDAALRKVLQTALQHYQAGRLPQAAALYQQVLQIDPNHADALHMLGVVAARTGRNDQAFDLINRAIQANPSNPVYCNDLGPVCQALNKLDEAIACYQEAIRLKPDYADAYCNMGNILAQRGRVDEAIASYQKAIKIKPRFAEVQFNLANLLRDAGRLDEAASGYQKAIAINPDFAEAHSNLGVVLDAQGKRTDAIAALRKAVKLKPGIAEAHNNLGGLLKDQRTLDEAISCFQKALAIRPDYAEACNNLADACKNQGRLQEAIALSQKAMTLDPVGLAGLDSTVRLATLYYLLDDLTQSAAMIERAAPIFGYAGVKFRAPQAYCRYVNKLLAWWKDADPAYKSARPAETLHVIGDSHVLSAHNVPVSYHGRRLLCRARWIEGCKQWHLGNDEANHYKDQVSSIMDSLPEGATILMSVGEIDCRPDEGILVAWKRQPASSLEDITLATVTGYLNYLQQIAAGHNLKVIIGGVPASNQPLDYLGEERARQFTGLLVSFNRVLREHALKMGMDFLDVFAMTDAGGGTSKGEWHIDLNHLRPDALVEAFDQHCLSGTTR